MTTPVIKALRVSISTRTLTPSLIIAKTLSIRCNRFLFRPFFFQALGKHDRSQHCQEHDSRIDQKVFQVHDYGFLLGGSNTFESPQNFRFLCPGSDHYFTWSNDPFPTDKFGQGLFPLVSVKAQILVMHRNQFIVIVSQDGVKHLYATIQVGIPPGQFIVNELGLSSGVKARSNGVTIRIDFYGQFSDATSLVQEVEQKHANRYANPNQLFSFEFEILHLVNQLSEAEAF